MSLEDVAWADVLADGGTGAGVGVGAGVWAGGAQARLAQLRGRGVVVDLRGARRNRYGAGRLALGRSGLHLRKAPGAGAGTENGGGGGVRGETRAPAPAPAGDASWTALSLEPSNLFTRFLETKGADTDSTIGAGAGACANAPGGTTGAGSVNESVAATDASVRARVLAEGLAIIHRVESSREGVQAGAVAEVDGSKNESGSAATTGAGAGARPSLRAVDLTAAREVEFDSISLRNFGPFGTAEGEDDVVYPLKDRGLVLLRAEAEDATGADSNGAGKTSLVMSVLWALTGQLDPRLAAGDAARVPDVAFDARRNRGRASKINPQVVASAVLSGNINGEAFSLTRQRGSGKSPKTDLRFRVGSTDHTKLSMRETQAVIDNVLGAGDGLLGRVCFFGQHGHAVGSLLGLTDTRLKAELSTLVDVDMWGAAMAEVRTRDRKGRAALDALAVEARVRGEEMDRRRREWEAAQLDLCGGAASASASASTDADVEIGRIQSQLDVLREEGWARGVSGRVAEAHDAVSAAESALAVVQRVATDRTHARARLVAKLAQLDRQLEELYLSGGTGSDSGSAVNAAVKADLPGLRARKDALAGEVGAANAAVRMRREQVSILQGLLSTATAAASIATAATTALESSPPTHTHSDDGTGQCPTCGQSIQWASLEDLASLEGRLSEERDILEVGAALMLL